MNKFNLEFLIYSYQSLAIIKFNKKIILWISIFKQKFLTIKWKYKIKFNKKLIKMKNLKINLKILSLLIFKRKNGFQSNTYIFYFNLFI